MGQRFSTSANFVIQIPLIIYSALASQDKRTYQSQEELIDILKNYQGWMIWRPLNTKIISRSYLQLIQQLNYLYHCGVIMGDHVIEFGDGNLGAEETEIKKSPLEKFLSQGNRKILLLSKKSSLNENYQIINFPEIEKRGEECIKGKKPYNFYTSNCDHMAHWITTGETQSLQINLMKKIFDGEKKEDIISYYENTYYIIELTKK